MEEKVEVRKEFLVTLKKLFDSSLQMSMMIGAMLVLVPKEERGALSLQ